MTPMTRRLWGIFAGALAGFVVATIGLRLAGGESFAGADWVWTGVGGAVAGVVAVLVVHLLTAARRRRELE